MIAPVNSSLPFLTCSALSPPVMIWTVATSMMTREMAPAVPARKVRSAEVNPEVLTGKQPRAVSIALSPQPPVGSKASIGLASDKKLRMKSRERAMMYVRMDVWFLSGKDFFIL